MRLSVRAVQKEAVGGPGNSMLVSGSVELRNADRFGDMKGNFNVGLNSGWSKNMKYFYTGFG
jgi:hypothetical protein